MTNRTKLDATKSLGAVSLVSPLPSTPAFAQMLWKNEDWDAEGDDLISVPEFREGSRDWDTYDEFDVDVADGLTEDELASEVFSRHDR